MRIEFYGYIFGECHRQFRLGQESEFEKPLLDILLWCSWLICYLSLDLVVLTVC